MSEASVNTFAHALCRLHVFHAWIEMSIKSTLDGFLLQMLLRSLREYTLKQLFFSISVNSGRIFTKPRSGEVNILPLFTEISKNNCQIYREWAVSATALERLDTLIKFLSFPSVSSGLCEIVCFRLSFFLDFFGLKQGMLLPVHYLKTIFPFP